MRCVSTGMISTLPWERSPAGFDRSPSPGGGRFQAAVRPRTLRGGTGRSGENAFSAGSAWDDFRPASRASLQAGAAPNLQTAPICPSWTGLMAPVMLGAKFSSGRPAFDPKKQGDNRA